MGVYLVAQVVGVPMWVALARRLGKGRAFFWSIVLYAFGFASLLPAAHPRFNVAIGQSARLTYAAIVAFSIGLFASARQPVGDSISGDVIDVDQSVSGESRHATYFALWNFLYKSAGGLITLLTGVVLQLSGFQPNETVQAQRTRLTILGFFAIMPLLGLSVAAGLMTRFTLGESEHEQAVRIVARKRGAQTLL